MDRRNFIKSAGLLTFSTFAGARLAQAVQAGFNPSPENGWRIFEVTTRVELAKAESATRVWIPLPSFEDAAWI